VSVEDGARAWGQGEQVGGCRTTPCTFTYLLDAPEVDGAAQREDHPHAINMLICETGPVLA
jgi:hypothetical protein